MPSIPPPRAIAVTIYQYERQFSERSGPLWDYFASRIPALYNEAGGALERQRTLRSDGSDSLICVIVALLRSMDLRSGFLGRPPIEPGDPWHRRSVGELFGFAFGKAIPGALSQRRIERWIRALKTLGVLTTRELKRETERGVRSVTAVRHLTDRLFELCGTIGQLGRERRQSAELARAQRQARAAGLTMNPRAQECGPEGYRRGEPARPNVGTASARAGPEPAGELSKRIKSSLRRP